MSQDKSVYICKTDYKKNCKSYVQNCIIWLPFAPNWYSTENCTIANFIQLSGSMFCEDFPQRNLIWILHWSPRMFWHIFQIFMTWLWINKFSLFCFLHPNFIILMAWNMKNEMSVLSLDVQKVKAKKKLSKCKKTFLKFKSY